MEVWNQLSPTQRIAITRDRNENGSTAPHMVYDGYIVEWLANFLPPEQNPYEPVLEVYYVRNEQTIQCQVLLVYFEYMSG
jgi:hypothetical protein